uniref:Uncharacterized protein n=1 Tax=Glossina austeni TaxID=7395 RepID=A0A1A9V1K1_GLOAU
MKLIIILIEIANVCRDWESTAAESFYAKHSIDFQTLNLLWLIAAVAAVALNADDSVWTTIENYETKMTDGEDDDDDDDDANVDDDSHSPPPQLQRPLHDDLRRLLLIDVRVMAVLTLLPPPALLPVLPPLVNELPELEPTPVTLEFLASLAVYCYLQPVPLTPIFYLQSVFSFQQFWSYDCVVIDLTAARLRALRAARFRRGLPSAINLIEKVNAQDLKIAACFDLSQYNYKKRWISYLQGRRNHHLKEVFGNAQRFTPNCLMHSNS